METMKCTSCGETVLSTDKFCKQCGKPNEQKTETAVAAENLNKKEKANFKLYSLRSIVAATFLGTPLAAGILIRKNSLNLGKNNEGLIALIVGIVATILLIVVPIDGKTATPILPFIYAGITYLIAKKMHGQILKTHKEEEGEFYSHWKAVGTALICAVIFIAGAFAYYYFTDEDSDVKNNEQQSFIPQNKNEEVYQITATDLYAAYNNNAAAADNKYKEKTLIVTGYIIEINKNYDGIYYVVLANKGGSFMTSTLCFFPANRNSSLTSLQKGQFVSIKGRCIGAGIEFATLPHLNNCSLEVNTTQPQSNPVNDEQTVNSKEIGKDFYLFIEEFTKDKKTQVERIKFPIGNRLTKENWFFMSKEFFIPVNEYYSMSIRWDKIDENKIEINSSDRVLESCGGHLYHYTMLFEKINQQWYLVQYNMTQIEESIAMAEVKYQEELRREQELREQQRRQELERQEEQRRIAEARAQQEVWDRRAEEIENQARNVFGGTGAGGGGNADASTGQGTGQGAGNQGNPFGNQGATGTQGGGSESGGNSYSLAGRSLVGDFVKPDYNVYEEGKVVVTIIVDSEGSVINATIGSGTNTGNPALKRAAIEAAKKTKFNKIDTGRNQSGTITYMFRLE